MIESQTICREDVRSQRETFLEDVLVGLRRPQKELPCKYFYDQAGSALFDIICTLEEYYLTRVELSILYEHAPAISVELGADIDLIELGSGSSLKTRLILEHLKSQRSYIPVDISTEHLERTAAGLADDFPNLNILPVAADFTLPFDLPDTGSPRARRVVYFPGSTIGNFTPHSAVRLLRGIATTLGHGGSLLIGFDLAKSADVLIPAYNDARGVTAAFNLNILARVNRELNADFDVDAFEHRAIYNQSAERVEMHLFSRVKQFVRIGETRFSFREGESILTEYSHKYPLERIEKMTADAGFTRVSHWTDSHGYFSVQHLEVTSLDVDQ